MEKFEVLKKNVEEAKKMRDERISLLEEANGLGEAAFINAASKAVEEARSLLKKHKAVLSSEIAAYNAAKQAAEEAARAAAAEEAARAAAAEEAARAAAAEEAARAAAAEEAARAEARKTLAAKFAAAGISVPTTEELEVIQFEQEVANLSKKAAAAIASEKEVVAATKADKIRQRRDAKKAARRAAARKAKQAELREAARKALKEERKAEKALAAEEDKEIAAEEAAISRLVHFADEKALSRQDAGKKIRVHKSKIASIYRERKVRRERLFGVRKPKSEKLTATIGDLIAK